MAKRNTQRYAFLDAVDADLSDSPATTSVVSQPLAIPADKKWSLNVFIDALTFVGKAPTFSIKITNFDNIASYVEYEGVTEQSIPEFVFKDQFEGQFMIVEYNAEGATGGTKHIELFVDR